MYTSALAHFHVCLEIAAGAASEKKRYSLAIVYDEVCRRSGISKPREAGSLVMCVGSCCLLTCTHRRRWLLRS